MPWQPRVGAQTSLGARTSLRGENRRHIEAGCDVGRGKDAPLPGETGVRDNLPNAGPPRNCPTPFFKRALTAQLRRLLARRRSVDESRLGDVDPADPDNRQMFLIPDQDQDDNRAARETCDIAAPQRYA